MKPRSVITRWLVVRGVSEWGASPESCGVGWIHRRKPHPKNEQCLSVHLSIVALKRQVRCQESGLCHLCPAAIGSKPVTYQLQGSKMPGLEGWVFRI